ncbi:MULTISPECIES: hypothetical protein [Streptomyces]|uniref:hypothetical protein n=1 Tax=Streptomyces TaxID=1883 RepID=UPI00240E73F3|nr:MULTISPECIES: hypothetical protein [Streptomyces]WFB88497.1 hypothetical protein MMU79_37285 [Streptomyces olivaceus]WGK50939.1 hypothetical protein M6G09_38025 [Streptomyces sp. B146]
MTTSSPGAASSAEPPATAARASRQARTWLASRRTPHPSRTPDTGAPSASAAAEPGALTAFVPDAEGAGRSARKENTAGSAVPSRGVHKPVLVAAAVAGAVLAAVPFIPQRGGTTTYEGQGARPVATFASEGGAQEPDGQSSALPLDDEAGSPGVPAVPLPHASEPAGDPAGEAPGTEENTGPEGPREHSDPGTDGKEPARSAHARRYIPSVPGNVTTADTVSQGKKAHDGAEKKSRGRVLSALGTTSGATSIARTNDEPVRTKQAVQKKAPAQTDRKQSQADKVTAGTAPAVSTVGRKTEDKEAVGRPVERIVAATFVLNPGQPVSSGGTSLSMEADGNLVVRDDTGVVRWAANTAGLGHHAVFQADGNLVVVAEDGRAVWSSGTAGNLGASLVVQTSGRVLIRSAGGATMWSVGVSR